MEYDLHESRIDNFLLFGAFAEAVAVATLLVAVFVLFTTQRNVDPPSETHGLLPELS